MCAAAVHTWAVDGPGNTSGEVGWEGEAMQRNGRSNRFNRLPDSGSREGIGTRYLEAAATSDTD
jgi:hypothetical protein